MSGKFATPKHPLLQERSTRKLTPQEYLVNEKIDQYLLERKQQNHNDPNIIRIITKFEEENRYKRFLQSIDSKWRDDFVRWICLGDNKNVRTGLKHTGEPVYRYNEGVRRFIERDIDMKFEFKRGLIHLEILGPGSTLEQAYLYYKYIIQALDYYARNQENNERIYPPWYDHDGIVEFLDIYNEIYNGMPSEVYNADKKEATPKSTTEPTPPPEPPQLDPVVTAAVAILAVEDMSRRSRPQPREPKTNQVPRRSDRLAKKREKRDQVIEDNNLPGAQRDNDKDDDLGGGGGGGGGGNGIGNNNTSSTSTSTSTSSRSTRSSTSSSSSSTRSSSSSSQKGRRQQKIYYDDVVMDVTNIVNTDVFNMVPISGSMGMSPQAEITYNAAYEAKTRRVPVREAVTDSTIKVLSRRQRVEELEDLNDKVVGVNVNPGLQAEFEKLKEQLRRVQKEKKWMQDSIDNFVQDKEDALKKQKEALEREKEALKKQKRAEREKARFEDAGNRTEAELNEWWGAQLAEKKERFIDLDKWWGAQIAEKEGQLKALTERSAELEANERKLIADYQAFQQKNAELSAQHERLKEIQAQYEQELVNKNTAIAEKDAQILLLMSRDAGQGNAIGEMEQMILQRNALISEKDQLIQTNTSQIAQLQLEIARLGGVVQSNEQQMALIKQQYELQLQQAQAELVNSNQQKEAISAQLQEQIRATNNDLQAAQRRVEELQQQLSATNGSNTQVVQQLQLELQQAQAALQQAKIDAQTNLTKLQGEYNQVSQYNQTLATELEKIKQSLAESKQLEEKHKKDLEASKKLIDEQNKLGHQIEQAYNESQTSLKTAQAKIENLQKQLDAAQDPTEINRVRGELESANRAYEELKEQNKKTIDELQVEILRLNQEAREMQRSNNEYKETTGKLRTELQKTQGSLNRITQENATLTTAYNELKEQEANTRQEKDKAARLYTAKKRELDDKTKELRDVQSQLTEATGKLARSQTESTKLSEDVTRLKGLIARLRGQNAQLSGNTAKELADKSQELQLAEEQLSKNQTEILQYQQIIHDGRLQLQTAAEEREKLNNQVSEYKTKLQETSEEFAKVRNDIKVTSRYYAQQLKTAESQKAALKKEYIRLKRSNAANQTTLKSLQGIAQTAANNAARVAELEVELRTTKESQKEELRQQLDAAILQIRTQVNASLADLRKQQNEYKAREEALNQRIKEYEQMLAQNGVSTDALKAQFSQQLLATQLRVAELEQENALQTAQLSQNIEQNSLILLQQQLDSQTIQTLRQELDAAPVANEVRQDVLEAVNQILANADFTRPDDNEEEEDEEDFPVDEATSKTFAQIIVDAVERNSPSTAKTQYLAAFFTKANENYQETFNQPDLNSDILAYKAAFKEYGDKWGAYISATGPWDDTTAKESVNANLIRDLETFNQDPALYLSRAIASVNQPQNNFVINPLNYPLIYNAMGKRIDRLRESNRLAQYSAQYQPILYENSVRDQTGYYHVGTRSPQSKMSETEYQQLYQNLLLNPQLQEAASAQSPTIQENLNNVDLPPSALVDDFLANEPIQALHDAGAAFSRLNQILQEKGSKGAQLEDKVLIDAIVELWGDYPIKNVNTEVWNDQTNDYDSLPTLGIDPKLVRATYTALFLMAPPDRANEVINTIHNAVKERFGNDLYSVLYLTGLHAENASSTQQINDVVVDQLKMRSGGVALNTEAELDRLLYKLQAAAS